MSWDLVTNLDAHKNQILNMLHQLLSADPGSPTEGLIYHNTTNHTLVFYNGSAFIVLGRLDQISAPTADVSLNSHKITNLATPTTSTDAASRGYVLGLTPNELTALAADYSVNSHKLTNVTDPTSAQDAATKNYVDAAAAGARDIKDSVRVVTAAALPAYTRTSNVITASANGALAAVDGVTLVAGDRLLLKDGAAGSDNGIYSVTTVGTGGTPYVLTRTSDADSSAEVTAGMYVWAEEGTANADSGWLLTTNNPITLNTTALTFTQVSALGQVTAGAGLTKTGATLDVGAGSGISVAADSVAIDTAVVVRKYATDVGDGASTSITVTHNLGTKDVIVSLWDNTTPFAEVHCEVRHTTTNTITLVFSVAPTSNQYRCAVHA